MRGGRAALILGAVLAWAGLALGQPAFQVGPKIAVPGKVVAPVNIPMPDLRGPSEQAIATRLSGFESYFQARCHATLNVVRRRGDSPQQVGAIYDQDPQAGSVLHCTGSVTLMISDGPKQPPPPPPVPIVMPDLRIPGMLTRLAGEFQNECHVPIQVQRQTISNPSPAGTLVNQYHQAGSVIGCSDSKVIEYLSQGPPPKRIPVPDLSKVDKVLQLQETFQHECDTALVLRRRPIASPLPAGAYVRQFPRVGSYIGCSGSVAVFVSNGPPTWPMPQLTDDASLAQFDQDARVRCHGDTVRVTTLGGNSSPPEGEIIDQMPEPGAPVGCSSRVTATFATPPPWWLLAMAGGVLVVVVVAGWKLIRIIWPPIRPKIVRGVPRASAQAPDEGLRGAIPDIAIAVTHCGAEAAVTARLTIVSEEMLDG